MKSLGPVDCFAASVMVSAGFLAGVGSEVRDRWLDLSMGLLRGSGIGLGSTELLWARSAIRVFRSPYFPKF
jgi:hypothetical protein